MNPITTINEIVATVNDLNNSSNVVIAFLVLWLTGGLLIVSSFVLAFFFRKPAIMLFASSRIEGFVGTYLFAVLIVLLIHSGSFFSDGDILWGCVWLFILTPILFTVSGGLMMPLCSISEILENKIEYRYMHSGKCDPAAFKDISHEKTLFESLGVALTNQRVVFGDKQFSLDDLSGALTQSDNNWKGVIVFFGLGVINLVLGVVLVVELGRLDDPRAFPASMVLFVGGLAYIGLGIFAWYKTRFSLCLVYREEGSETLCKVRGKQKRKLEKLAAAIRDAVVDRADAKKFAEIEVKNLPGNPVVA